MESRVGSIQPYMLTAEEGGTVTSKGKEGKPIYTAQAAGQGDSQAPIKRLPRPANRMSRINLSKGDRKGRIKTKRQKFFLAALQTLEDGNKYAYIDDPGRSTGIYRITGKINRGKGKRIKNLKMRLMWNLDKKSYTIKGEPWLEPASNNAASLQPIFYGRRLNEQLRRQKLIK